LRISNGDHSIIYSSRVDLVPIPPLSSWLLINSNLHQNNGFIYNEILKLVPICSVHLNAEFAPKHTLLVIVEYHHRREFKIRILC